MTGNGFQLFEEIGRQIRFFIHQDWLNDAHRLVIVWCFFVVVLQYPAHFVCTFRVDHPARLADEAGAGSLADFYAEGLRLASLAQNAVTVNPAVLDKVGIIGNNKQIDGMNNLPIADIREEVRLPNSYMTFSFNHNT